MAITVSNLFKEYFEGGRRKEVLAGVSFAVPPGCILALTGPNGAGKTTLLKILSTIVVPTSGTAVITGHDIARDPRKVRAVIGSVYDAERSFYQILSAGENLKFYARLFGLSGSLFRARLGPLAEAFGLAPWLSVKFSHCSSGVRQKLAVARALLTEPKVLLVDELTRSLDEKAAGDLSDCLKEYCRTRNAACIAVTHDRAWAKAVAGRSVRLEDGRIREN